MKALLIIVIMVFANCAFSQELKYDLGMVADNRLVPIINAGKKLPVNIKVPFTTSDDNQPAVFVHIGQNKDTTIHTITRFDVYSIPHKPAGKVKIEVTFSIEKNKSLKISVNVEGKAETEVFGPFKVE